MDAALAGVHPGRAVVRALADPGLRCVVAEAAHIDVLAVGKAAEPMATALEALLTLPWRSALVVSPMAPPRMLAATEWIVAAHPVPDARSLAAGREALRRAASAHEDDLLVCLISGGASSLLAVPVDGVPFADKQQVQRVLLQEGADIGQVNAVRKHLSAIKGGRLAAASRARVLTLALSDVIGDDVSTIGSGPTTADPTTFLDALSVLRRCGGTSRYPASCIAHLEAGAAGHRAETPKELPVGSVVRVVASLADALDAAEGTARSLGYTVHRIGEALTGEARTAGAVLGRHVSQAVQRGSGPWCVISGGETTVTVTGNGLGGRNQEVALALAAELAELADAAAICAGTDGVDGPTDAAGAVVDVSTIRRAASLGLSSTEHLRENNSYAFFDAIGDLLHLGPTGTNVGDVQIVLVRDAGGMEGR